MNSASRKSDHALKERSPQALTLLELLVTLVLSTLVLGMVLPLLHQLMRPSTQLEIPATPAWQRSLQADLAELVSPEKCGMPVLQILPASEVQPYPQIVLETFCRAGGASGGAASRGPSEVRYVLEPDPGTGVLVLVRYAKGWHDDTTSRHVLAERVSSWNVDKEGMAVPAGTDQMAAASSEDDLHPWSSGGALRVEVTGDGTSEHCMLWVPRLTTGLSAASQPREQNPADGRAGEMP